MPCHSGFLVSGTVALIPVCCAATAHVGQAVVLRGRDPQHHPHLHRKLGLNQCGVPGPISRCVALCKVLLLMFVLIGNVYLFCRFYFYQRLRRSLVRQLGTIACTCWLFGLVH